MAPLHGREVGDEDMRLSDDEVSGTKIVFVTYFVLFFAFMVYKAWPPQVVMTGLLPHSGSKVIKLSVRGDEYVLTKSDDGSYSATLWAVEQYDSKCTLIIDDEVFSCRCYSLSSMDIMFKLNHDGVIRGCRAGEESGHPR